MSNAIDWLIQQPPSLHTSPTIHTGGSWTFSVIERTMPPQDVCVLIPRICDYVTFHAKRDFANVIKDLEMER